MPADVVHGLEDDQDHEGHGEKCAEDLLHHHLGGVVRGAPHQTYLEAVREGVAAPAEQRQQTHQQAQRPHEHHHGHRGPVGDQTGVAQRYADGHVAVSRHDEQAESGHAGAQDSHEADEATESRGEGPVPGRGGGSGEGNDEEPRQELAGRQRGDEDVGGGVQGGGAHDDVEEETVAKCGHHGQRHGRQHETDALLRHQWARLCVTDVRHR